MRRTSLLLALLLALSSCTHSNSSDPKWFKGNLHTHSLWSDGNDFPEMICDWYRDNGYNFLAISDHNTLAEGEKWMKIAELRKRGSITGLDLYLDKYHQTAQTRGNRNDSSFEVRLTNFKDYKSMTERPGKFLIIQSEEISDQLKIPAANPKAKPTTLPIHMNATNMQEVVNPQGGNSVREVLANNFKAIIAQRDRLGVPMIPHINHPNFGYALTAEDLASVTDEHFFEIYNGHPSVNQLGDAKHIPVERMWDIANTIRMVELHAPPLMGLGSDDTHEYHLPTDQIGMSFSTVSGRNPTYTLTGQELYVRALITSSKPPVNPSLKDQKKQAWTQPVVWREHS